MTSAPCATCRQTPAQASGSLRSGVFGFLFVLSLLLGFAMFGRARR